jgi:hypothetical protein
MNQQRFRAALSRLIPLLARAVSEAGLPCAGDWGIQEQYDGGGMCYLELSATLCPPGESLAAPPPTSYGRLRVRITGDPWDALPVIHLRLTTGDWCKTALMEAWNQDEVCQAVRRLKTLCESQASRDPGECDEHWRQFLDGGSGGRA